MSTRQIIREGKVCVVGGLTLVAALRFCGVDEWYEVYSPEKAREVLRNLLEREDVYLIVLEERFREVLTDFRELLETKTLPLILLVPSLTELKEYDFRKVYRDLHRRTVGFEIQL